MENFPENFRIKIEVQFKMGVLFMRNKKPLCWGGDINNLLGN